MKRLIQSVTVGVDELTVRASYAGDSHFVATRIRKIETQNEDYRKENTYLKEENLKLLAELEEERNKNLELQHQLKNEQQNKRSNSKNNKYEYRDKNEDKNNKRHKNYYYKNSGNNDYLENEDFPPLVNNNSDNYYENMDANCNVAINNNNRSENITAENNLNSSRINKQNPADASLRTDANSTADLLLRRRRLTKDIERMTAEQKIVTEALSDYDKILQDDIDDALQIVNPSRHERMLIRANRYKDSIDRTDSRKRTISNTIQNKNNPLYTSNEAMSSVAIASSLSSVDIQSRLSREEASFRRETYPDSQDEWMTVRNRSRGGRNITGGQVSFADAVRVRDVCGVNSERNRNRNIRTPNSAAITIRGVNEGFSYADTLRKAREGINLETLGIEKTIIRRGISGGIVIRIPGAEHHKKADELAGRLRGVLGDGVNIGRPVRKGEIMITGLDDSVSSDEIVKRLSETGDCLIENIKIGQIRITRNRQGSVWAQLPLAAAIKIVKCEKISVGWSYARVRMLDARPSQCFKCWEYGHTRNMCRNSEDMTGTCFRCGERGHHIQACMNDFSCYPCKRKGTSHEHKMGSFLCASAYGNNNTNYNVPRRGTREEDYLR